VKSYANAKLPPVTIEEIERHLDLVAELMVKAGKKADLLLPIWRRLERERDTRKETEAAIAAARDRVRRSREGLAA
jgi:hypothetical protein